MRALRLQSTANNSLVYVDPENFGSTLTLRHDNRNKLSSNKTSLVNSRSEIITGRVVDVIKPGATEGGVYDTEAVSVRTSISGSTLNKEAVRAALADHLHNLNLAAPDLTAGLMPVYTTSYQTKTTEA